MNRNVVLTSRAIPAALIGLCWLAIALAGCNVSPEKNPAFVSLKNKVAKLESDNEDLKNSIKQQQADLIGVNENVQNLKTTVNGMGGSPQQMEAVTKRLDALEQQIQAMQGKAAGKPSAEGPKKGEAGKAESARGTTASKTPASAKPSPAAAAASQPKATGKYYAIEQGDTLQSLAQKHGTTAAKIADANHLPADASLTPGDQIFIPNP